MKLKIKRVYDMPEKADGIRILIDRLWPRGIRKNEARIDLWLKALAPSTELRKWFGHDPEKWEEFKTRYHKELSAPSQDLEALRHHLQKGPVTLLYGVKDEEHNNAVALMDYLTKK
jgi:uncharacterized protein YeaO (DUF488 family)